MLSNETRVEVVVKFMSEIWANDHSALKIDDGMVIGEVIDRAVRLTERVEQAVEKHFSREVPPIFGLCTFKETANTTCNEPAVYFAYPGGKSPRCARHLQVKCAFKKDSISCIKLAAFNYSEPRCVDHWDSEPRCTEQKQ